MDHTFDDSQLESHIFDSTESMDLSKQYFTTLQILRIARQRIDNNRLAWEELRDLPDKGWKLDRLHESPSTHHRVLSTLDKFVLSEGGEPILEMWEEQRDRVTQLVRTKAKYLTERIDQKTKEVESLRDGVRALQTSLLNSPPPSMLSMPMKFGSLTLLQQLFNATSLREAMKGMALNRAIYLFTAVTIIYTPLSFLTVRCYAPLLIHKRNDD